MRIFRLFLAFGLVVCGSATAQTVVVEPVTGAAAQAIPFTTITQMQSVKGEGEVNFLKRVGQTMTAYSKEKHVEVCARVAEKSVDETADSGYTLYGAVITTNGSNVVCVEQNVAPEGFALTAKTIHNHGYTRMFRVNNVDAEITQGQFLPGKLMGERVQNRFSPQDLKEAGYLATPDGLLFQDGLGFQTDYGAYDLRDGGASGVRVALASR